MGFCLLVFVMGILRNGMSMFVFFLMVGFGRWSSGGELKREYDGGRWRLLDILVMSVVEMPYV